MTARRDFRGPGLFHLRNQRRGQRHVIQFGRHTSAILVRPGKELQRLIHRRGIVRLLVHQNKAGAGDRPTLGAGLIGQDQIITVGMHPVGVGRRRLEGLGARRHGGPRLVGEQGVRHLVLLGVCVLHIADRSVGLGGHVGDALVTLGPDPRRPLHRGIGADARQEFGAGLGEILGEQEIRSRAVGPVNRRDRGARQRQLRIQTLDLRIVPLGDIAQVNAGHRRAVQMQLAGLDAFDVHHRHDAPDDHGKLQKTGGLQIVRLQRHVRGAESHCLGLDLLDTAA